MPFRLLARTRVDRRLRLMSPGRVFLLALALTAGLAVVDDVTGYELSFSVFYLAPVALVAWYANRSLSIVTALICAWVWFEVDGLSGHDYSSQLIPIWNAAVRLAFFLIVALLLNHRRETEAKLIAAKRAAEAATRAKAAFLAGISHELRTPLNAIINYAGLMMEEAEAAGQPPGDVQKINRAGRHLLQLINNVLDFSKIEAGKLELFIDQVSVAEIIEDVRVIAEPLVRRNRNRLEIHCPESLPPLRSDSGRLRQILFNLVGNAAKFTSDGEVRIGVRPDGHVMVFEVADTGIGMSPEQLARVFDAYAQADGETYRRYGGSGLGLTISRLLCDALGGTISVESAVGQGSRFTVRIPSQADGIIKESG
jgi:signal transduction histidine kinase